MSHPLLRFFSWAHLPTHLAVVSKPFHQLASELDANLPDNAEKTVALRKLLEAKDCAVRAVLPEPGAAIPVVAEPPAKDSPKPVTEAMMSSAQRFYSALSGMVPPKPFSGPPPPPPVRERPAKYR